MLTEPAASNFLPPTLCSWMDTLISFLVSVFWFDRASTRSAHSAAAGLAPTSPTAAASSDFQPDPRFRQ